jgi:hypothetical protein
VVTAEEGIGDKILFATSLPEVITAAEHCVIECGAQLLGLFRRSFATATVEPVSCSGDRFKPIQAYEWLLKDPPIELAIEAGSLFQHCRGDLAVY